MSKIIRGIGMNVIVVLSLLLLATLSLFGNDDEARPSATGDTSENCLNSMSWIEGNWRGKAFGGVCNETWSSVSGDSRTGMFSLVKDGKVVFYEFMFIGMVDGKLTLRLRHFNSDMSGWEEKEKWVEFPFLSCTDSTVEFDGLGFEKIGDNSLNIWRMIGRKDSEPEKVDILYSRTK